MRCISLVFAMLALGLSAQADPIFFGNNTGDYIDDDICDDPRFVGEGTETAPDWAQAGRDAVDCKAAVDAGKASFWYDPAKLTLVTCTAEDFGDDTGADYANDGICDDPRFMTFSGLGISLAEHVKTDATDCRRLCEMGLLFERPYQEMGE